jgi:hypothetical protein
MDPRNPNRNERDDDIDAPDLEQQDWDDLEGDTPDPDVALENGDLRYDEERGDGDEALEEEDDNPYQNSDEALPDDDEEAAIERDLSGRR